MTPIQTIRRRSLWLCSIVLGSTLAVLVACGGGGGSTTSPAATVMLSGTAAAGLPLVGSVTVKDAKGATKTVPIDANGGYTVDVAGMTAPVMLRAEGNVGATHYVIHSASADISANGTVNITPLTDLIVSNAAGQIAATYFAGSSFANLTQAELDAETAALKAKLLPVLSAMGVDAAIDLLRTPFTPLSSALDKALDVLRVSVNTTTHVATITNLVNQIAITDDLATKAAAESSATPLAATGMDTAATDVTAIRQALIDAIALFHTGLPQPAQVLPLLSSNFLHQDAARADFANEMAQATDLVGASVASLEILGIDYTGASPLAQIRFVIKNKQGISTGISSNWMVIKEGDGVWRLHGNQSVLEIEAWAFHVKVQSGCVASGFEFNFWEHDSSNSANIDHLMVSGPGLPAGGLKYQRPANGDKFPLVNGNNASLHVLTQSSPNCMGSAGMSDNEIAAIPDFAAYTIAAYAADGSTVSMGTSGTYTERIPKRPMTLAEVTAATFPTIATSAPFAGYGGGSLTISGTGIADSTQWVWLYLGLTDGSGQVTNVSTDLSPTAAGGYSGTLTLTAPAAVTRRDIRVASHDAFGRLLMTTIVLP